MRRFVSTLLFTTGTLFVVVAAARLIFGIAMDLPFLRPVSLGRFNAVAMIAVALVCFVVAALVGRRRGAAAASGSRPAA
jgi:hypothetical protein